MAFSSKRLLNFEIDDRLTRIVVTSKDRKGGVKLHDAFMIATPEGHVADGLILEPDALGNVISEALAERGYDSLKKVAFTLRSGKIATREVTLPGMKENKIGDVIKANASDYFPVDMSRYEVSYTLMELVEKGEDAKAKVFAAAVPKVLLETYFTLASSMGLEVEAIDHVGNADYYAITVEDDDEVVMYADIGTTGSDIMIRSGSNILMQRHIGCGGDDLIGNYIYENARENDGYVKILSELREVFEDYDGSIPEGGVEYASDEEAYEAYDYGYEDSPLTEDEIIDGLDRLIANIERIRDYFNTNKWETPISRVVLMGPCGDIRGLSDLLYSRLDIPVNVLEYMISGFDASSIEEPLSCYVSVIGSNINPVDLMPEEYVKVKKQNASDPLRIPKMICAGAIAAGLILSIVSVERFGYAQVHVRELREDMEKLAYTEDIYTRYTAYENEVQGFKDLEAIESSPNDKLSAFINELEIKMPSDIKVLSATCDRESISMNITTRSKTSAAKVIQQIRQFKTISDVEVSGMSDTQDEAGVRTVSFAVNASYGTNLLYAPASGESTDGTSGEAVSADTTAGGSTTGSGTEADTNTGSDSPNPEADEVIADI